MKSTLSLVAAIARASRLQYLLAFALFTPCAILTAQETETDDNEEEDVFELSPFTVSVDGDFGYLATNAVSGTRLNTPIKDIPMALEVITAEFIEDTGATDFKETLNYSAGLFTETFINNTGANVANGDRSPSSFSGVGNRRTNAIVIRGFNAPFQMRMGFRVGTYIGIKGAASGQGGTGRGGVTLGSLIDSVNIERNEVVRGPGALLYGLGVISGIVNVMPHRPMDEFRTEIAFGIGSEGYRRAALDTTGPLLTPENSPLGQLNYRLMGSWLEQGDWTQFFGEEREYGAFQLEWRPSRRVKVFGELQAGMTRFEGDQNRTFRDSPGDWIDPYSRSFVNPFGENHEWGREAWVGPYPEIWDPAQWPSIWDTPPDPSRAAELAPLEGDYMDPARRVTGPDPYYQRDEWSGILNLEWTPTDQLAFNLGYYYSEQDEETFRVNAFVINNNYGFVNIRPDAYPYERIPSGYVWEVLNPREQDPVERRMFRTIGTYWTKEPGWAASRQFRGEVNYTFETPFFGDGDARHSLLLGIHDIRDQADVGIGGTPFNQVIRENQFAEAGAQQLGINEDGDGFRIRSIYDWNTTIRYDGEPLVRPLQDYYTTTLWYTGYYAVYQGQFFRDRLTVISGARRDRYQAKEEKWRRANFDPANVRTGTIESYYNFEDPVKIDTGSFGMTYKLTEDLSVYGVVSQGVIPNTGQRDGDGLAIDPEETLSKEIGLKFDFLDGRISGTISAFQIERKNAIWSYGNAPAPGKWEGGRNPFEGNSRVLDPELLTRGAPINYGFSYQLYFRDLVNDPEVGAHWREKLGIVRNPIFGTLIVPKNAPRLEDGQLTGNPAPGVVMILAPGSMNIDDEDIADANRPYVYLTYDQIKADPELFAIAEKAFADSSSGEHPIEIDPIQYGVQDGSLIGLNASANSGASVTFEEESFGVDGQVIYTASENLQFIFSFAHIEREASSGFQLAQAQDYRFPELGAFGTEYDIWVRDLGRENFSDPTDPTTLKGGIQGKSLYFGAEDTFNVWGKYTFREGAVEGLSIGLGMRYSSGAQTHIPIGGGNLEANRYPTPKTEDFYQMDAVFIYRKAFKHFDLKLALNIYNVLDDDELYTESEYVNQEFPEITERRRTRIYRDPRSYRVSATFSF